MPCEQLILAVGHSARDTFRMLYDAGVAMAQKPFSVGVRIEHHAKPDQPRAVRRGGGAARCLGAAEYKLQRASCPMAAASILLLHVPRRAGHRRCQRSGRGSAPTA